MTENEKKALRHIVRNGSDRNLTGKSWKAICKRLNENGFLTRRIGDWAWVPTDAARREVEQNQ